MPWLILENEKSNHFILNLDDLKNIDKKYWILAGVAIVVVSALLIFGGSSSLFKGSLGDLKVQKVDIQEIKDLKTLPANTCSSDLNKLEQKKNEVELLNESNQSLNNYEDRKNQLNEITKFLDTYPSADCGDLDTGMLKTFSSELSKYQLSLVNIEKTLNTEINENPICPLENRKNGEYLEFSAINALNEKIISEISNLNASTYWGESEDLAATTLMGDLAIISTDNTASPKVTRDNIMAAVSTPVTSAQLNAGIDSSKQYLEEKFGSKGCNYSKATQIIGPAECAAGSVFSESSGTCVAMQTNALDVNTSALNPSDAMVQLNNPIITNPSIPDANSDQMETEENVCTDSLTILDNIYTLLNGFSSTPEDFDEGGLIGINSLINELPEAYVDTFQPYTVDSVFTDEANETVRSLNSTLFSLASDGVCESETIDLKGSYELIEFTVSDPEDPPADPDPNEGDEPDPEETSPETLSCPEGATAFTLNDGTEVCACTETDTIVDPDGTCEEDSQDPPDDSDTPDPNEGNEMIVCPDGSEVLDIQLCPMTQTFTCEDGTEVEHESDCPNTNQPLYCADGVTPVVDLADCPENNMVTCSDGSEALDLSLCPVAQAETFVCADGVTVVTDLNTCPNTSANETQQNTYNDTVSVNQDAGNNNDGVLSMTTNTNPNIMSAPEVQGDTGPGMATNLLLIFLALTTKLLFKFKIN